MITPGARRGRLVIAVVAAAVAIGAAGGVATASSPPTVPPGYVQLVDDTGLLTVVVPDTWTDIDTVPGATSDGAVPWISASPDLDVFETTFDVPGVRYVAAPFTDDPASMITDFGLPEGACVELEVQPYDDGLFVGVVQLGTSCGSAGTASWTLVAASPPTRRSPL